LSKVPLHSYLNYTDHIVYCPIYSRCCSYTQNHSFLYVQSYHNNKIEFIIWHLWCFSLQELFHDQGGHIKQHFMLANLNFLDFSSYTTKGDGKILTTKVVNAKVILVELTKSQVKFTIKFVK